MEVQNRDSKNEPGIDVWNRDPKKCDALSETLEFMSTVVAQGGGDRGALEEMMRDACRTIVCLVKSAQSISLVFQNVSCGIFSFFYT